MAEIQPTLDLIDGAIEDYLSPDAMRWTPDEDQRAETSPDDARVLRWAAPAADTWLYEQMQQMWREHGIEVEVSNLVPDGQVYVVNRRALADAQREALSNISFVYDTTPMRTLGGQLSESFRVAGYSIRAFLDVLADAVKPTLGLLHQHRRNAAYRRFHRKGYTPPRGNPRMRALNLACRRRQLARRRRHR